MKDKQIDLNKVQDEHRLPAIPDMFLIDDRGQGQAFKYAINNNPYRYYDKAYYQAHNAFFPDLEIERLFSDYLQIDELENPRQQSIKDLFFFLPTDPSLVKFRQDILKDFIEDEALSHAVEEVIAILKKQLSGTSFFATNKGMLLPYSRLLREYERVLTELIQRLGSNNSEGLQRLSHFFEKMKDHPDMKIWKDYDEKIADEVPFYLSLTRRYDFTPIAFSLFGFENESFALTKLLKQATDRFGKIKTDTITGERLETFEVSLSHHHQHITLPVMDAFVQILMQVFGNPFGGLENHVRYTIAALNQLTFYRNAARLHRQLTADGIPCVFPEIKETNQREIIVDEAHNFLIGTDSGKKVIPNDIRSNSSHRVNVITGSNYGGKSWYMKTVGLIQLMAQAGLFVPARYTSLSLVDHVFTHFPEKEGAGDIESRYSWELERGKRIFTYATPYSLALFDEPCSGTAYEEGLLQTSTFIKISQQIGMTTFFTTHMHEIAKGIEDDKDTYPYCDNLFIVTEQTSRGPRYTYKVMRGRADHSGAAQLAEAKGCDETALQKLLESRILTNSLPATDRSGR